MKLILIVFCGFILTHCAADRSNRELCKIVPDYNIEKHENNIHKMEITLLNYIGKHAQRTAIVARAGSDLSTEEFYNPDNQKYSHAGFIWKSSKDNKWKFKHLLNICEGSTSGIFTQIPFEFFDDAPYFYDIHVGIPSTWLQRRIADILESDLANVLHNPQYSKISNPFNSSYQNSNEWVLAVIASAQSGVQTLEEAQWHYTNQGFFPSQVYVGSWREFFSSFISNVTLSDHTQEEKDSGWYSFVSAASVFQYLKDTDSSVETEICHEAGCNIPVFQLNQ